MRLVSLGIGTIVEAITHQLRTDVPRPFLIADEEVAPQGCLWAPLCGRVDLGLEDDEDLERVLDGDLVQRAVAEIVALLASIAVELDVLPLVLCDRLEQTSHL